MQSGPVHAMRRYKMYLLESGPGCILIVSAAWTQCSRPASVDFNPKLTHPMGIIHTLSPAVSQPQFRFDLIVLRRS